MRVITSICTISILSLLTFPSTADVLTLRVEEVVSGLTSPVLILEPPDGTGRLFVVDQAGFIRVIDDGTLLQTPLLDLTGKIVSLGAFGPGSFDERGLLGLAPHPNFASNGLFYVYYSAPQPDPVPVTFEVGDPLPPDVTITGGTIGTQFTPPFYCSGLQSLEVQSDQSATIEFDVPVISVRFFLVHRSGATAGTVTALAPNGSITNVVTSNAATVRCDPNNFFSIQGSGDGIKQLVLQAGTGTGQVLFLDDLEITRFNHMSRVSEFAISTLDPNVADPNSERLIFELDEPQFNHNAGWLGFSPAAGDDALYISFGDGGRGNDVAPYHTPGTGNGQDPSNPYGSILRLDISGTDDFPGDPRRNYAIPGDNPFVGNANALDEIYAYGLRNPFRCSFDIGGDHDLFCGDAGQNLFEEVSIIPAGGNMGWNTKEGFHCFDPNNPTNPPAVCSSIGPFGEPLIDPIIEYPHFDEFGVGLGQVVIGGYVYRGSAFPGLSGIYVFADFATPPFASAADGRLFLGTETSPDVWQRTEPIVSNGNENKRIGKFILGFGQNQAGEVFIGASDNFAPFGNGGSILRILPTLGDLDGDGDVDGGEFEDMVLCLGGPDNPLAGTCPGGVVTDLDDDTDGDMVDFATFSINFTGQ